MIPDPGKASRAVEIVVAGASVSPHQRYRRPPRKCGSGRLAIPATPLAARLRMLRLHAHMNQQRLSCYVGASQGRVSDWETGAKQPSLTSLQRYANTFGMTVSQLLAGAM